jgi:predicted  nucleic acid-binding Zn-ribbon protein
MASPATIFKELHRLWRHARDLQTEIDLAPRVRHAQEAKVLRQEESLRENHDAIKHLKVATHEKEVSLRVKIQQIDKHSLQLNQAGSKKEYEALQHEIAAEKKACSDLEDDILNTMAETEDRAAQTTDLEQAVKRAKEEMASFEISHQARQKDLVDQLAKVREEIQAVEQSMPADAQTLYQRLLAARGEDALSAVQGKTCAACYTEITAQNYHELVIGQMVMCKSCGRILYLPG